MVSILEWIQAFTENLKVCCEESRRYGTRQGGEKKKGT
jgi:hypothetical protein